MTVAQKIDPSLFAQKGQARPAVTATEFTNPLMVEMEAPRPVSSLEKSNRVLSLLGLRPVRQQETDSKVQSAEETEINAANDQHSDRRVAMTLRLSLAQHLRLKFFCRRSGRTAQDVMERAVFDYIRNHAG